MNRSTLSELCAAHALASVANFKETTAGPIEGMERRSYVRLVERFAPLLTFSGLVQSAAWLDEEARDNPSPASALRAHFKAWFEQAHPGAWQKASFAGFALAADDRIRAGYHAEAVVLAQWLKTFAVAELKPRPEIIAPELG